METLNSSSIPPKVRRQKSRRNSIISRHNNEGVINFDADNPEIDHVRKSKIQNKPDMDFGNVEEAASHPHRYIVDKEYDWKKYIKQNQIAVLGMLIFTVVYVVSADIFYDYLFRDIKDHEHKAYIKDTLAYISPVFTFLLGVGTRFRNDS